MRKEHVALNPYTGEVIITTESGNALKRLVRKAGGGHRLFCHKGYDQMVAKYRAMIQSLYTSQFIYKFTIDKRHQMCYNNNIKGTRPPKREVNHMKNVMVVVQDIHEDRIKFDTFDEAYEYLHNLYTSREGFWWEEEEFEEEHSYGKVKAEFEAEGYYEFSVEILLTTVEYYIDNIL